MVSHPGNVCCFSPPVNGAHRTINKFPSSPLPPSPVRGMFSISHPTFHSNTLSYVPYLSIPCPTTCLSLPPFPLFLHKHPLFLFLLSNPTPSLPLALQLLSISLFPFDPFPVTDCERRSGHVRRILLTCHFDPPSPALFFPLFCNFYFFGFPRRRTFPGQFGPVIRETELFFLTPHWAII